MRPNDVRYGREQGNEEKTLLTKNVSCAKIQPFNQA